jgi:hypothetical protein
MLRIGVPVALAMLALLAGPGGTGKQTRAVPATPVTHHEQPIGLQLVLHARRQALEARTR